ncbi:MAG: hypothetical protein NVS2B16_06900 [Chloroflexota bacterium]
MTVGFIDILSFLVAAGFILLVLSLAVSVILSLRRRPAAEQVEAAPAGEADRVAREERRHMADERGSELIQRRIDLDTRRGTLGSYFDVNDAFTRLEQRFKDGEISEEEFEAEKVQLLTEGHE